MNINKYQQRGGATAIVLFVVALICCVYLIIKVLPVYMDNHALAGALYKVHELLHQEEFPTEDRIRSVFLNALIPQNVDVINSRNYNKTVKILRTDDGFEMTLIYQQKVPLFANASLLFDFEHIKVVP
jgi:hypothetical protein